MDNPEFREGLEDLASHYKSVITLLGEDVEREGLQKTPMRVAKAMQVLTRGYSQDPRTRCSPTHCSKKTTNRWWW